MDQKPPRLLSLVLVPSLLTLLVTVLRLVGQLAGWSPRFFGLPEAGGSMAIVGIGWLIFVFGLWFGFRVQRSGAGVRSRGRALAISALAVAVMFGGLALCRALDLVWFPDADHPGPVRGMSWFICLAALGVVIAACAWPRMALLLFVYAVLARIPVLAVTWLALEFGWETHYVKLPPGLPAPAPEELFTVLAMPQVTFWPAITIVAGTVMACLGALLGGRGAK
ncbi:MAG: hypothetical protein FJ265_01245 [Planctomycetes bacterium]|nr:hypothetical protein [Planctomycetota bacterium]